MDDLYKWLTATGIVVVGVRMLIKDIREWFGYGPIAVLSNRVNGLLVAKTASDEKAGRDAERTNPTTLKQAAKTAANVIADADSKKKADEQTHL